MDTWILLRGLTREASHWGAFAGDFQTALPQAKVVALDLPGNGQLHALPSPLTVQGMVAACRAELARQGVLPPFHLFAMSLGAMVATEWARTAPEEISGCVLVNTSFRPFSPFFHRLRPRNYAALLRLALRPRSAEAIERTVWRLTSNAPDPRNAVIGAWVAARTRHPVSPINALRPAGRCGPLPRAHCGAQPSHPAAHQPERPAGGQPLLPGNCPQLALRPGSAPAGRTRPAAGRAPVGHRAGAAMAGPHSPIATSPGHGPIAALWATRALHARLTNFIVSSPGATTLPSHSPWRSP